MILLSGLPPYFLSFLGTHLCEEAIPHFREETMRDLELAELILNRTEINNEKECINVSLINDIMPIFSASIPPPSESSSESNVNMDSNEGGGGFFRQVPSHNCTLIITLTNLQVRANVSMSAHFAARSSLQLHLGAGRDRFGRIHRFKPGNLLI